MASSNDIEKLFRRYRREAVLLHRRWPPHVGPQTNSHLGGLPRLPESCEWPRTSSGTPLHFLAQIDCADIGFKTALPNRGVLFFFGRDDCEQIWNLQPPASDDCRVLYALDAFPLTPPRQPPAELPPIEDRRNGPNVHAAWPIVPLKFDSFPDASALPPLHEVSERFTLELLLGRLRARDDARRDAEMADAYDAELKARRAAALAAAAAGAPPPGAATGEIRIGTAVLGSAASGPHAFPQHWAYIHYLARAIVLRPAYYAYEGGEKGERIVAGAERWLARSREVPLDRPVAEDDRQALRTWLASIESPSDPTEMGNRAADLAFTAAFLTIRSWAGDPALAALIPDHVYDAYAPVFYRYGERHPEFSQMLGHAPSAQDALPADDPTICLLNLSSDVGIGWGFGDDGQCTFWITPRDLARRDFSKVEGTIVGH